MIAISSSLSVTKSGFKGSYFEATSSARESQEIKWFRASSTGAWSTGRANSLCSCNPKHIGDSLRKYIQTGCLTFTEDRLAKNVNSGPSTQSSDFLFQGLANNPNINANLYHDINFNHEGEVWLWRFLPVHATDWITRSASLTIGYPAMPWRGRKKEGVCNDTSLHPSTYNNRAILLLFTCWRDREVK